MTALSININKIATLRNARGGNIPNLIQHAIDLEKFGAQGITVHPRPDERHIRYDDVRALKKVLSVEFNIEGNPKENSFVELVLETNPEQVTLVPDSSTQLTSDHGWDTIKEFDYSPYNCFDNMFERSPGRHVYGITKENFPHVFALEAIKQ